MQFSFTETLAYVQGLGQRRLAIGRASLGFEGAGQYPVLVVEPDPLCGEINAGLARYDLAFLVLDRELDENDEYRKNPTQWPEVLTRTGQWADELIEMLRAEYPGALIAGSYTRVALTEYSGELSTGWRCELQLQVSKQLDRNANAALFGPASL